MEATEMMNSKYLIEPKMKLHNILKTDNSFHEHLKYTFFGYNNLQKPQNQPQLHIRQQVIYHTNELQFLTHSTVFIHWNICGCNSNGLPFPEILSDIIG